MERRVESQAVTGETGSTGGDHLRTLMIAVAVATAFADSSIVVLGLPEMFSSFEGATPVKLALVVMAYNAVVAAVGLLVYPRIRQPHPGRYARVGTVIFTASAVGCGVAGTLWGLIAIRAVQRLGAGLLLVSSLALLVAGAILLGLGLLGLAFLSAVGIWMAMVALAICGVGVGLTVPYLTDTALKDDMGARKRRADDRLAPRGRGRRTRGRRPGPLPIDQAARRRPATSRRPTRTSTTGRRRT